MPRFVVLQHDHPQGRHWDFLVETGPTLATWSLAEPPREGVMAVRPLPDHRLAYLDYEGPVSQGRGTVTRWDRGSCEIEEQSADRFAVVLHGARLVGRVVLAPHPGGSTQWEFSPSSSS